MEGEANVWESEDATFKDILEAWIDLLVSLETSFVRGYRDPVPEADLAAAEERLGFEFHPDVKTFFAMSDGFQPVTPGHGGGYLLPNDSEGAYLSIAMDIWEDWHEEDMVLTCYENVCERMSPEAAAVARRSPPIALMPVMTHDPEMLLAYAVECVGPRAGAVFGIGEGSGWVAPSFGELLRRAYRFYSEGRCRIDFESLSLDYDVFDRYSLDRVELVGNGGAREYIDLFVVVDESSPKNTYDLYSWRW